MKYVVAVFLIVGNLLVDVKAEVHISSAVNGGICTNDNGRRCPELCDNGHCTCFDRRLKGVPAIACVPGDSNSCTVTGDPKIITFLNETLEYPVPCQYLLTAGSLPVFNERGNDLGAYEFSVFAYNKRVRGKVFTSGFRVDIARNIGGVVGNINFMVDGSASAGTYTYVTQASTDGGITWFDWQGKGENPLLNFDSYSLAFDDVFNRIFFNYPEISLFVAFRAPDDIFLVGEQTYLSGIVLSLDSAADISYDPRGVCFTPDIRSVDMLDPFLSQAGGLLMLASTNQNIPQDFFNASSECEDLKQPILQNACQESDDYHSSINICTEIFEHPNFMRCYSEKYPDGDSGNSYSLLVYFKSCIRALCQYNNAECNFITTAINPACYDDAPEFIRDFPCLEG